MKRALATLALAGLALTGCSALTEVPAPAATSAALATVAPLVVAAPSVADYIAATEPIRGELQAWVKSSDDVACGFGEPTITDEELHETACRAHAAATASQAYLVGMVLEGLSDEAGTFYLGYPPLAIETSVGRSIESAGTVQEVALRVAGDDCNAVTGCTMDLRDMKAGMHGIVRELDSWATHE